MAKTKRGKKRGLAGIGKRGCNIASIHFEPGGTAEIRYACEASPGSYETVYRGKRVKGIHSISFHGDASITASRTGVGFTTTTKNTCEKVGSNLDCRSRRG